MLGLVLLLLTLLSPTARGIGPLPVRGSPIQSSAGVFSGPGSSQQSIQVVLMNIDERLRTLENLYSPRYTTHWEISLEQQARHLDMIESRLGHFEVLLELRLDKLTETIGARKLEEELSMDQMNHKVDITYERLSHQLGYIEARLDIGISKIQSSMEASVSQMEKIEAAYTGRQEDIETAFMDTNSEVADLKKNLYMFQEVYNKTMQSTSLLCDQVKGPINQLTESVNKLDQDVNQFLIPWQQYRSEEKSRNELTRDNLLTTVISNITTKVNNISSEMLQRTHILESLSKDSMSLCNATRREVQDGFRSLIVQLGRRGLFQSDHDNHYTSLELSMEALADLIQRRFSDLGRKHESSFQMLIMTQNLFLESCHRIQQDEPQLENKLTLVLEKILDTITNSCTTAEEGIGELHELIKSHNSHVIRTVTHATNTVLQASEQSNADTKHLDVALTAAQDNIKLSLIETMEEITKNKSQHAAMLGNISNQIQELQEQIVKLSEQSLKKEIAIQIFTELHKYNMAAEEIIKSTQNVLTSSYIKRDIAPLLKKLAAQLTHIEVGRLDESINSKNETNMSIDCEKYVDSIYNGENEDKNYENDEDYLTVEGNENQDTTSEHNYKTNIVTLNISGEAAIHPQINVSDQMYTKEENKNDSLEKSLESLVNYVVVQKNYLSLNYDESETARPNKIDRPIKITPNYSINLDVTNETNKNLGIVGKDIELIKFNLDDIAAIIQNIDNNKSKDSTLDLIQNSNVINRNNLTISLENRNQWENDLVNQIFKNLQTAQITLETDTLSNKSELIYEQMFSQYTKRNNTNLNLEPVRIQDLFPNKTKLIIHPKNISVGVKQDDSKDFQLIGKESFLETNMHIQNENNMTDTLIKEFVGIKDNNEQSSNPVSIENNENKSKMQMLEDNGKDSSNAAQDNMDELQIFDIYFGNITNNKPINIYPDEQNFNNFSNNLTKESVPIEMKNKINTTKNSDKSGQVTINNFGKPNNPIIDLNSPTSPNISEVGITIILQKNTNLYEEMPQRYLSKIFNKTV